VVVFWDHRRRPARLGPASTIAILLPVTMHLDPTGSVIMLSGFTMERCTGVDDEHPGQHPRGSGFGGDLHRRFPNDQTGESRAGPLDCRRGVLHRRTFGPWPCPGGPGISRYALKFGPPEYVGLLLFSITMLITLSETSLIKGLVCGILGMVLATVGLDP